MLYEIKVFRFMGNKRKVIHSMEVSARDPVMAIEKACIRLGPERMAEIREIPDPIHRYPIINKVQRDGVI
jgi:hypothetical protein